MALPKIDTPIYEIDLPLSKQHIRFRPFLVKEQKNLFMALEADDAETITNNIRQVLNNCTLTEGVNIDELPLIDVEYYFLNLRGRSVGEVVEAKYRCNNDVDDGQGGTKECNNIMETQVNVLEIGVEIPENSNDLIKITDTIAVKMKYPSFNSIQMAAKTEKIENIALEMVIDSIDIIYDGQQAFYAKDSSREEILQFLESLTQPQFEKIEEFFASSPKLNKTIDLKCSKCGFQHKIFFEGLESFFD